MHKDERANALRSEVEVCAVTTLAAKRLGDDVGVRDRLKRSETVVLGLTLVDLGARDLVKEKRDLATAKSAEPARQTRIDALLKTLDLLGKVVDCGARQISAKLRR